MVSNATSALTRIFLVGVLPLLGGSAVAPFLLDGYGGDRLDGVVLQDDARLAQASRTSLLSSLLERLLSKGWLTRLVAVLALANFVDIVVQVDSRDTTWRAIMTLEHLAVAPRLEVLSVDQAHSLLLVHQTVPEALHFVVISSGELGGS
jgi:hypothetical protein